MRNTFAVLRRELAAYLLSPLGWVVLTIFLLVQGYSFYVLVDYLGRRGAPSGPVLRFFFGGTSYFWLFLIAVVATITMRLIAEERRAGTIEALLTAPVTEAEVVLGKFAAALVFYAALWAPTVTYLVVLRVVVDGGASSGGAADFGSVVAGYLGLGVIGASCISVGLLASAIARHQIIAALVTYAILALGLLLEPLALLASSELARDVLTHASPFAHMEDFARGIVDSRHLVFHGSVVVFCLVAATKMLERRKWA